ncbi:deaminase domain-containing protein [uncultured Clostridium sp.]|uniref:deaminase domain-containing protein n=1 Tax=uncultured Clostridium sp. TaxID=59620 RepID=UPI0025EFF370|nr:deaminase domain-containing protein [uncultured Clostridium sp.]
MKNYKNKSVEKKIRIDISSIEDLVKALNNEGYNVQVLDDTDKDDFKKKISVILNIKEKTAEQIYSCISAGERNYRTDNIEDFVDYMEKIIEHDEMQNKLWNKISAIDRLKIQRIEYERKPCIADDVEHMLKHIENVRNNMFGRLAEDELKGIVEVEEKLDSEYVYTKDIELLKKMIIHDENCVENTYEEQLSRKTIYIDMPHKFNSDYIKPEKGTVEYHEHITRNIPRIKRLVRNVHKYMECVDEDDDRKVFVINQSMTLQDSINVAVAYYDGREFKAISGSNDVEDYCTSPDENKAAFTSSKVNRLGKLGVGYKREFDSEKKIVEEIHRLIEEKEIEDKGTLIMYSRWEPCPSCCYAISQFCAQHPDIDFQLKFGRKYGEK